MLAQTWHKHSLRALCVYRVGWNIDVKSIPNEILCTGDDAHRNIFLIVDICDKFQQLSIISEYVWNVKISKNVEICLLRSPGHKHSQKNHRKIPAGSICWLFFHLTHFTT